MDFNETNIDKIRIISEAFKLNCLIGPITSLALRNRFKDIWKSESQNEWKDNPLHGEYMVNKLGDRFSQLSFDEQSILKTGISAQWETKILSTILLFVKPKNETKKYKKETLIIKRLLDIYNECISTIKDYQLFKDEIISSLISISSIKIEMIEFLLDNVEHDPKIASTIPGYSIDLEKEKKISELLEIGNRFYNENKYDCSIDVYQKALSMSQISNNVSFRTISNIYLCLGKSNFQNYERSFDTNKLLSDFDPVTCSKILTTCIHFLVNSLVYRPLNAESFSNLAYLVGGKLTMLDLPKALVYAFTASKIEPNNQTYHLVFETIKLRMNLFEFSHTYEIIPFFIESVKLLYSPLMYDKDRVKENNGDNLLKIGYNSIIERDFESAYNHFCRAYELGVKSPMCSYYLGFLLWDGLGVKMHRERAIAFLFEATTFKSNDKNNELCLILTKKMLGLILYLGIHATIDVGRSLKFLQDVADSEFEPKKSLVGGGCYHFAMILYYEEDEKYSNKELAIKYFKRGVEMGNSSCTQELAKILQIESPNESIQMMSSSLNSKGDIMENDYFQTKSDELFMSDWELYQTKIDYNKIKRMVCQDQDCPAKRLITTLDLVDKFLSTFKLAKTFNQKEQSIGYLSDALLIDIYSAKIKSEHWLSVNNFLLNVMKSTELRKRPTVVLAFIGFNLFHFFDELGNDKIEVQKNAKSMLQVIDDSRNRNTNKKQKEHFNYYTAIFKRYLGELEDSLLFLDKCISSNPNNDLYHYYKADILFMLLRYQESLNSFNDYLNVSNINSRWRPNALYSIAGIKYLITKDKETAIKSFEAARNLRTILYCYLPYRGNFNLEFNDPLISRI